MLQAVINKDSLIDTSSSNRAITSYSSRIAISASPPAFDVPVEGSSHRRNIAARFGGLRTNLNGFGDATVKKSEDMITRLRPRSIILASCKPGRKPGFRPGLRPGFRQVRACGFVTRFRPAFDFFCRKHGREPQQVRWFVRVLDKWNEEKPVLSKFAAGFQHAFDLLATRFAAARIMECGL